MRSGRNQFETSQEFTDLLRAELHRCALEGRVRGFVPEMLTSVKVLGYETLDSTMDIAPEADALSCLSHRESSPEPSNNSIARVGQTACPESRIPFGLGASYLFIVSKEQTEGRGQWGRSWISNKGTGLYFTLVAVPKNPVADVSGLPLAVGAGICAHLRDLGADVKLKWPNDLLWWDTSESHWKKMAGILVETSIVEHELREIRIGVGMNLYACDLVSNSLGISLSQVIGREVDYMPVATAIFARCVVTLEELSSYGFAVFKDLWEEHSMMLGKTVEIECGRGLLCGKVDGLSARGGLALRDGDRLTEVVSGHVLSISN